MSQLAYTQDPAVAIEGMRVDMSRHVDDLSATADVAISFGLAVTRVAGGAADDRPPRAALPTGAGGITGGAFLGVAVADVTLEQLAAAVGYSIDDALTYRRVGRIWVLVEEAVVLGDDVFVRHAAGAGGTQLGAFRTSADTATAAQVPGASFRSIAGIGGLAIVELVGGI